MLLELTATVFVTAYVTVAALGHVLVFTAIVQCLRQGPHGGATELATAPVAA